MARPAPLAGGNGAVYLTVVNGREIALQLVAATSPAAATVEIHETIEDDGVMRMVHHPEGFAIAPMSRLELRPGGKHIMLVDLTDALAVGDTIDLTLTFEEEGGAQATMGLTVPVMEPDGVMNGHVEHAEIEHNTPEEHADEAGEHDGH